MVNDSVLQCIIGDHAGGTFPVMMHRKTKGFAVSTVVFEYALTIQNIHPSQGSHEFAETYKYFYCFSKHLFRKKNSLNTAKTCSSYNTLKIFLCIT